MRFSSCLSYEGSFGTIDQREANAFVDNMPRLRTRDVFHNVARWKYVLNLSLIMTVALHDWKLHWEGGILFGNRSVTRHN